jgi:hypothetical protein
VGERQCVESDIVSESTVAERAATEPMEDARTYATWARLEREFALGDAGGKGHLLLPRHSRTRFIEFVDWVGRDAERRELLPTVMHATSIYARQTRLVDFGADEMVQAAARRASA